ncbi:MAG: hypothetical protein JNJ83_11065 [Verrucomicrobiaceae bacterium]|nr:hypothetical protein [Verrucomicrobiaceae bacterium]
MGDELNRTDTAETTYARVLTLVKAGGCRLLMVTGDVGFVRATFVRSLLVECFGSAVGLPGGLRGRDVQQRIARGLSERGYLWLDEVAEVGVEQGRWLKLYCDSKTWERRELWAREAELMDITKALVVLSGPLVKVPADVAARAWIVDLARAEAAR